MSDIIWGNVGRIISGQIFELNLTHRKDSNKNSYSNLELIKLQNTDIPTIPLDPAQCTVEILNQYLAGRFIKCEVQERDDNNHLCSNVSLSGQGGY